jgi:hypothetical protein
MREEGFWPRLATGGVVSGSAAALDESGPPAFVWPEGMADRIAELNDLELAPWQQHKMVWPPPGFVEGMWVDEVTHYFASSTPEPPPAVTLADIVRAYHDLEDVPKVPEKIKLTTGEWDAARECLPEQPPSRPWAPSSVDLAGVPVELVDDPQDSDLWPPPVQFELRPRQNGKQLARERLGVWPTPKERS